MYIVTITMCSKYYNFCYYYYDNAMTVINLQLVFMNKIISEVRMKMAICNQVQLNHKHYKVHKLLEQFYQPVGKYLLVFWSLYGQVVWRRLYIF